MGGPHGPLLGKVGGPGTRELVWGPMGPKAKIVKKAYIPPTLLKMKFYDIEPRLKVYIPVFQPPGHSSDGLGLY